MENKPIDDLNENDLMRVRKRVKEFLKQQPQYSSKVNLEVTCDEGHNYFILYGRNAFIGIVGLGQSEQTVYDNFVENWYNYYQDKQS